MSSRGADTDGLEREVGTVLDVFWRGEDETYRGNVEKVEGGVTLIYYPCDRRRKTSEYRGMFPGVDFSCVTEGEDVLWGTMNESNEMMCERAHRFMEWVMRRPEQHIAVVTHSARGGPSVHNTHAHSTLTSGVPRGPRYYKRGSGS